MADALQPIVPLQSGWPAEGCKHRRLARIDTKEKATCGHGKASSPRIGRTFVPNAHAHFPRAYTRLSQHTTMSEACCDLSSPPLPVHARGDRRADLRMTLTKSFKIDDDLN